MEPTLEKCVVGSAVGGKTTAIRIRTSDGKYTRVVRYAEQARDFASNVAAAMESIKAKEAKEIEAVAAAVRERYTKPRAECEAVVRAANALADELAVHGVEVVARRLDDERAAAAAASIEKGLSCFSEWYNAFPGTVSYSSDQLAVRGKRVRSFDREVEAFVSEWPAHPLAAACAARSAFLMRRAARECENEEP